MFLFGGLLLFGAREAGCCILPPPFFFFFLSQVINLDLSYLNLCTENPSLDFPAQFGSVVTYPGTSKLPKGQHSPSQSRADMGSPPWRDGPLLQNHDSLCFSCCRLSFGGHLSPAQASLRLVELTASAELPSPTGSEFEKLCLTLTPAPCSVYPVTSTILPTRRKKWSVIDSRSQEQCLENQSPALKK